MDSGNASSSRLQAEAADFFRSVLTHVLDELLSEVDGTSKKDKVKLSLRNISLFYKHLLSEASSDCRSDWSDPANRCAYVFLYLMQHCNLVHFTLQENLSDISLRWRSRNNLKVCCVGGGPGSDLVGLTTFLRINGISPPALECLILDRFPDWKRTWDTISRWLPESFRVTYQKCDIVKMWGTSLDYQTRQFVKQSDMVTLVKSFSAVAAYFRNDRGKGDFLRGLLRELKQGCFVLYIDNDCGGNTEFQRDFASQAGLDVVYQFRGTNYVPRGQYSATIRKYCDSLEYRPMTHCDVIIQLFCKRGSVRAGQAVRGELHSAQDISTSRGISPTPSTVPRPRKPPHRPTSSQVSTTTPFRYREDNPQTFSSSRQPAHDDRNQDQGLSAVELGVLVSLGLGVGVILLVSYFRNT